MLSHTRWASHMSVRIWDVPYAYGPIYAYGVEHIYYYKQLPSVSYVQCELESDCRLRKS